MKILIYRVGSIGDSIIALPALKHIRSNFPNDTIKILTNFPNKNITKECSISYILDNTNISDGYIVYPKIDYSFINFLKLINDIKNYSPDILIYLMPARGKLQLIRDFIFYKFICNIKTIIGLNFIKNYQINYFYPKLNIWEHESHRLGRLISPELGQIDYLSKIFITYRLL